MFLCGSVAQLVEHRTFNPLVEGSNPSRPTSSPRHLTSSARTSAIDVDDGELSLFRVIPYRIKVSKFPGKPALLHVRRTSMDPRLCPEEARIIVGEPYV